MWRNVVLVILGVSAIVHAQPNPRAAELFDQGRELAKQGQYAAACQRFAESFALDHAAGTQLNLADCHEHQGHLQIAWHFYDAAATEFKRLNDPKREDYAREHADALLPKLATVIVKIAKPTPGLVVRVGGREVAPPPDGGPITDHFDPGDVTVEVQAPQKAPFTQTAAGAAGATVVVDVPAFDAAVEAPKPSVGPRRKSRVRLAYVVGAAGGAALLTGIAVGLVARANYNAQIGTNCTQQQDGELDCNSTGYQKINSARTLADVGTGLAVGGVVAGAAAAIVFFTAPRDIVVAPATTGRDASVSLTVHF